jgi:hypothetical protein
MPARRSLAREVEAFYRGMYPTSLTARDQIND